MNKEYLKRKIEAISISINEISELLIEFLRDTLLYFNDDEEITQEGFEIAFSKNVDEHFIYHKQAIRYLFDENNITDFAEAINVGGYTAITDIAIYYFEKEARDIIAQIFNQ